MRPKLTPEAQRSLTILGQKNPKTCDSFEKTVGHSISKLSMDIEQGNITVSDLEKSLMEATESLTKSVGEYVGWANALVSYYQSQMEDRAGPIAIDGGVMPSTDPPSETDS